MRLYSLQWAGIKQLMNFEDLSQFSEIAMVLFCSYQWRTVITHNSVYCGYPHNGTTKKCVSLQWLNCKKVKNQIPLNDLNQDSLLFFQAELLSECFFF